MQTQNNSTLRTKLKAIQNKFQTFAVSAEADKKKPGTRDGQYRYTPGWEIVETLRKEMDAQNIMLEPNIVNETHEMVEYPIYKMVNGQITSFIKKEMYVTVCIDYTWIDTVTGETIGPIRQYAAGANGIDKSIGSAISLAERYFFLKYFQITTREMADEPDAHDSENLMGIPASQQPLSPTWTEPASGQQQIQMPMQTNVQMQPSWQTQQQQNTQQTAVPAQPTMPQANGVYANAVEGLVHFQKGTESHAKALNSWLTKLRMAGYDTSAPEFASTLVNTAQLKREGRLPQ